MADYTTPKSVEGYYMGLDFDNSDFITKSQVKSWITEFSTTVDSQLRRKYPLPITNKEDKVILQLLVEKFVVGKVDGIMRVSTTDEDKKYLRNRNMTKDANDMMADILSGKILLNTSPKNLAPMAYQKGNYDN